MTRGWLAWSRTVGAAGDEGTPGTEREDGQRLWQYALLLMVVSLGAYHRLTQSVEPPGRTPEA